MKPTPEQIAMAVDMKLEGCCLVHIRDSLNMTEGQINRAWRDYRRANPGVQKLKTRQKRNKP